MEINQALSAQYSFGCSYRKRCPKAWLAEKKQSDWKAVNELTERLRKFDANDPVKYDFCFILDWGSLRSFKNPADFLAEICVICGKIFSSFKYITV
jgi:hypothetical protein